MGNGRVSPATSVDAALAAAAVLQHYGNSLKSFSKELVNDGTIVTAAVHNDGIALEHISEELVKMIHDVRS